MTLWSTHKIILAALALPCLVHLQIVCFQCYVAVLVCG